MKSLGIRAQQMEWYSGISIGIFTLQEDNSIIAVKELTAIKLEPGSIIPDVMKITKRQAQILLDDLWHCGIRPSDGTGNTGQLAATQKHLDDMKEIAFFALKIPKK